MTWKFMKMESRKSALALEEKNTIQKFDDNDVRLMGRKDANSLGDFQF